MGKRGNTTSGTSKKKENIRISKINLARDHERRGGDFLVDLKGTWAKKKKRI